MTNLNESLRYILQEEVAIEDFDDGSLLLLCKQLELIEINKTAKIILDLMNGQRNLKQIIKIIADESKMKEKNIREDIQKLVNEIGSQGVIKPVVKLVKQGSQHMNNTTSFLANPDVSLREENGDGAILFNTDTDSLLIINPIGLIIWKFLKAHPRTKSDIITHLKERCNDVPPEQVDADVNEFMNDLYTKGFIGEVVDEKTS